MKNIVVQNSTEDFYVRDATILSTGCTATIGLYWERIGLTVCYLLNTQKKHNTDLKSNVNRLFSRSVSKLVIF